MIEPHKDPLNYADGLGAILTTLIAYLWHGINEYGHVVLFLGGTALGIARFILLCYQIRNARRGKD